MILPAELRRKLGVEKGDRVILQTEGDRVELTTARALRRRARAIVREAVGEGQGSMVDALIAERREEARREEEIATGPSKAT